MKVNDESILGFPIDLGEDEFDPVEEAICEALGPVLSGIFARELFRSLDGCMTAN